MRSCAADRAHAVGLRVDILLHAVGLAVERPARAFGLRFEHFLRAVGLGRRWWGKERPVVARARVEVWLAGRLEQPLELPATRVYAPRLRLGDGVDRQHHKSFVDLANGNACVARHCTVHSILPE